MKLSPGRSFRKIKLIPPEISQFLTIEAINKDIIGRKKIADNDRRNNLRVFDTKSNFLFTTSEAKRDY